MPCKAFKTADGITGLVCSRGPQPKPKPCAFCQRPSSKLCDFIVRQAHAGNHQTCDKPLCVSCAVAGGKNTDYCPDHPGVAGQLSLGTM